MLRRTKCVVLGIIAALTVSASAAVTPQTTQDSMSGNWLVVNGQKRFMSGMNLAWINFGTDVGDKGMDINSFTDKVKQIRKAGGNAMRWWLHTDAQNCPKIDATGAVTGLGANSIRNMRMALDTAYNYGVVVDMCLFSFDLLVPGDGTGKTAYSSYNLENNYKFLTDTSKITTYLNKGLKPILDSVGNHPAVMCWEVFNEPEGMLASANWSHVTKKITQNDILRITNRIAGFVHRNSKKMASTGLASFQYCSEYSTEKLVAAGGDPDGYLDFYMAHYYPEWQGSEISPFHNVASKWNMDKPILIGEFPANDWSASTKGPSSNAALKTSMTSKAAFNWAYDKGYAGAMSWAMTEQNSFFGSYETTAPSLTDLFTKHKDDIMFKDVTVTELTGDLAMQIKLDLPGATATPEAELNGTFNFTGVDSLIADIYLPAGTSTSVKLLMVVKSSSSWTWCPSSVTFTPSSAGTWLKYSAPIASFASSTAGTTINLADIKQILIQFVPSASSYSGTVLIDNVRSKTGTTETVISDFNKTGSTWSEYEVGTADNIQISLAQRPGSLTVKNSRLMQTVAGMNVMSVNRKLMFTKYTSSDAYVRVLDLSGKTLKAIAMTGAAGTAHTLDCSTLAAGKYLVEVMNPGVSKISSIVLQ
jgi:hypothetical protein